MYIVFYAFPSATLNMINTNFITLPKPWYEIAYISGFHYDGISPIRMDCPVTPPPLTGYAFSETITISWLAINDYRYCSGIMMSKLLAFVCKFTVTIVQDSAL